MSINSMRGINDLARVAANEVVQVVGQGEIKKHLKKLQDNIREILRLSDAALTAGSGEPMDPPGVSFNRLLSQSPDEFFYHLAWRWHNSVHGYKLDFTDCPFQGCELVRQHLKKLGVWDPMEKARHNET